MVSSQVNIRASIQSCLDSNGDWGAPVAVSTVPE